MKGLLKRTASYLGKLQEQEYGVTPVLSGAVNYLLDSYFAKIDARMAAMDRGPEIPYDPVGYLKELWLGCEIHQAVTLNEKRPAWMKGQMAYAFWCLFTGESSTYDAVPFIDSYAFKEAVKGVYALRIQSAMLPIALGKSMKLPVFGTFFVKDRGTGQQILVNVDFVHDDPYSCNLTVMSSPGSAEAAENFLAAVAQSLVANDIYHRQCLTFTKGYLDFTAVTKTAWGGIILKPQIKDVIRQNTVCVLNNMDALASINLCPNRNTLLISPPGMAKTSIFRAISHELEQQMTRIWCTGKSIEYAEHVTALFSAARSLAPCILFIEDMDLFGADRSSGLSSQSVLNEFLACLDGAQENFGVVVVASTNDFSCMDEALVNRPGRFDVKVEIPFPDEEERHKMLVTFFDSYRSGPDQTVTPEIWKNVIGMTDGFTGAYMRDVAKSCVIRAVDAGCFDGACVTFSADHLIAAAEQSMRNYQLGKRAKKHHVDLEASVEGLLKAG
jgi:hypothetical protein